jgi:hypothetical protein
MAEISVCLSFSDADGPAAHSRAYRWVLRALALWNCLMMVSWGMRPKSPLYRDSLLYSGRVRYGVPKRQEFLDAKAILKRGWADCGPLGAWRLAELWLTGQRGPFKFAPWVGGADIRIYSREVGPDGVRLYHCQVRNKPRAGVLNGKRVLVPGAIEDPSRLLGMRAVA